jgi:PEP-CTERM motif
VDLVAAVSRQAFLDLNANDLQRDHKMKKLLIAATLAASSVMANGAQATTLTTGPISMGLFDNGGLGSGGVGLARAGNGDAITPGCLCEGWGAAANGVGNYVYGGSSSGFTSAALSAVTADSAVSTVTTSNGLLITHTYTPVGDSTLFKIDIVMKNVSGAAATDIRYARTLDWDVNPGHFSDDFTTIYGGTPTGPGGKVLHTSTDPFAAPDPMVTRSANADTNVTDAAGDLGGYFIFSFGDLGIDESVAFTTFIGAGETTASLLSAFGAVGVEAYSYTFDNDGPVTFGYGFTGLGLPPVFEVPEPATMGLMGLGLLGLGFARRRKAA